MTVLASRRSGSLPTFNSFLTPVITDRNRVFAANHDAGPLLAQIERITDGGVLPRRLTLASREQRQRVLWGSSNNRSCFSNDDRPLD